MCGLVRVVISAIQLSELESWRRRRKVLQLGDPAAAFSQRPVEERERGKSQTAQVCKPRVSRAQSVDHHISATVKKSCPLCPLRVHLVIVAPPPPPPPIFFAQCSHTLVTLHTQKREDPAPVKGQVLCFRKCLLGDSNSSSAHSVHLAQVRPPPPPPSLSYGVKSRVMLQQQHPRQTAR